MVWSVEWGEKLDFLLDIEASGSSPAALENRPVIYDWMREYLAAFDILNQTRQYGMGPNPIQLTEILAYLTIYGASDTEVFIKYVLKMDASFLTARAKQDELNRKAKGN